MPDTSLHITELDARLNSLFLDFEKMANQLEFTVICDLSNEQLIEEQKYPGIYKIEIFNDRKYPDFPSWIASFKTAWEHSDYKKKFTPNCKKKRIAKHTALADWIPLYIGKSKHIAGRVWEHLHLALEQPTTSLKLKARPNLTHHRFQLSTVRIEVQNYDLIMPRLEKTLRDKFNPILGRQ